MVRNFWNPDEIPSSVPITEAHFKNVGGANDLVQAYQPHWFDIEAMICFFTHCMVYGDRETFLPAYERVQRLADEVREFGWNEDRVRRCKALVGLEKEVYEVYPHLFVQQG